jgi:hypothetical protein
MAWEAFGRKNGAAALSQFTAMIRRLSCDRASFDPIIGCTVLTQPFFWPQHDWIDLSGTWSPNVVRGRYYDPDHGDGEMRLRASKPHGDEVRIILYGHHRIVYQVESREAVVVLGIFHGAMDLPRYLP